jgi:hypothetical protein
MVSFSDASLPHTTTCNSPNHARRGKSTDRYTEYEYSQNPRHIVEKQESQGFQKAGYDGAMWSRKDKDGDTILVATHVDSIVTGSDDDKTDIFVLDMLDRFDGTCERNLTEMLGMEWERDIEAGTSILHQRVFTEKLLEAFGFWQYSKPTKTPQAPDTRLSAADKPSTPDPVLHRRYRAIVGALIWLNQGTRPDISHAYSELSKFGQCPGQRHVDAVEYCLKYLAGTVNLCLHYGRTKDGKIEGRELNRLWGWVDTGFAADLDTRRSHTGYVIKMNGGPISWKSVKQKSVSPSTAESEGMPPVRLVRSFCTCVFSCVNLDSLNWGLCTCIRTRCLATGLPGGTLPLPR